MRMAAGEQLKEKDIFTRHYSSLCNTLTDIKTLLPYFVQENIISTSDIEEISALNTNSERVVRLLTHISGPLEAGDARGFHTMLNIMKEHGSQSTKDLAVKMSSEIKSSNSEREHEVVNDKHRVSSDIRNHHTSSSTKTAASSTVKTPDPLSVQFSRFVATIEALLEQCHDKLEESKQFCMNLTYTISDNSNDEHLFNDEQLQKINACTTFKELFVILRKHWSWRAYSILTHIISITGLKEAQDEVDLFETRMASYQGMKIISEEISPEAIPPDYIRLSVLITKPYRDLTVEKYAELHDFVFRNLDTKHYTALPYIKFLFGSLQLEWYVLKKAAPYMIKMAQQNEEIFMSNSVVFIQVDQDVVLDCRAKDKTQIDDPRSTSSAYRSGGYDYNFVNPPPDRLLCKICHLPCREAQQSKCCGSVYCKCDIDQLEANSSVQPMCPLCRSEEFVTYPNLSIDREIQQLMVYCPDKDSTGCNWTGKLNDVDKHYSEGKECETECDKCKATVKHKLLNSHITSKCPCYCPYCDITAEREVISSEHKEKCCKFPITCPNDCGLHDIPRGDMDEHKKVCPLELIHCEFDDVGCETKVFRKDAEFHMKENMIMHLQLTRLKLNVVNKKLEESNAKYANSTEEVTKSLSELQEGVKVLESLLENSKPAPVDKDLLLNLLQSKSCVDAEAQTDNDIPGRKHNITTQNYLALSKNLLIWSTVSVVIAIFLFYAISLRQNYVGSPDLPTVNEYHENVSTVLYELIDKSTLPWPTKLHHWSSITTIAPVVIKLPNFSKRKNTVSYSEPFYAFQNGYKLCLKYYPYGFHEEDVEGHYMSVYLHLVRGPYDQILEKNDNFPLKRDFIIELLNPREDNDHVRVVLDLASTSRCSSKWNRRITEVSINPDGCGSPKLILLGKYNFETHNPCVKENYWFAKTICYYLTHDDALYFRVQESDYK